MMSGKEANIGLFVNICVRVFTHVEIVERE
jgi:hypothetical protein